jgi:hypothetical protein
LAGAGNETCRLIQLYVHFKSSLNLLIGNVLNSDGQAISRLLAIFSFGVFLAATHRSHLDEVDTLSRSGIGENPSLLQVSALIVVIAASRDLGATS